MPVVYGDACGTDFGVYQYSGVQNAADAATRAGREIMLESLIEPPGGFNNWKATNPDPNHERCGRYYSDIPFLGGWLGLYYCDCESCAAEGGPFFTMFSGERSGLPGPHFTTAKLGFEFLREIYLAELQTLPTSHN